LLGVDVFLTDLAQRRDLVQVGDEEVELEDVISADPSRLSRQLHGLEMTMSAYTRWVQAAVT
jgi:hypothetical protein